ERSLAIPATPGSRLEAMARAGHATAEPRRAAAARCPEAPRLRNEMTRPKFLADHDLNEHIIIGVRRRESLIEFSRVRDDACPSCEADTIYGPAHNVYHCLAACRAGSLGVAESAPAMSGSKHRTTCMPRSQRRSLEAARWVSREPNAGATARGAALRGQS